MSGQENWRLSFAGVRVVKSSGLFQKPQCRCQDMKEHLVRHGSKHKIQVHTTKSNKRQQKQKQNRTHFQNKKQRETRERSLTKTKARGKNENRWVQQTHTLTHSLTYTDTCLHIHPPTYPPTWFGGKRWGKGGFDRHTFYKTRDYNINRK